MSVSFLLLYGALGINTLSSFGVLFFIPLNRLCFSFITIALVQMISLQQREKLNDRRQNSSQRHRHYSGQKTREQHKSFPRSSGWNSLSRQVSITAPRSKLHILFCRSTNFISSNVLDSKPIQVAVNELEFSIFKIPISDYQFASLSFLNQSRDHVRKTTKIVRLS